MSDNPDGLTYLAADTSSVIAFLQGHDAEDVRWVNKALRQKRLILPPPVLSELLSDTQLPDAIAATLLSLPLLSLEVGFWERAGRLRALILKQKKKARLADVLIAQCCIDHEITIISRDKDFRHFADYAKVVVMPVVGEDSSALH